MKEKKKACLSLFLSFLMLMEEREKHKYGERPV